MTVRTANATFDELSDQDYRDMFDECYEHAGSVRGIARYVSHRILSSKHKYLAEGLVSHGAWDKYYRDPSALTRRMKTELRVANGLAPLPPTVQEAISDVSLNATVIALDKTEGELNQVVVGNASDSRWRSLLATESQGPEVELPPKRDVRVRPPAIRPVVEPVYNERRERIGVSWREVIEAGLAALETVGQGADGGGDGEQKAD